MTTAKIAARQPAVVEVEPGTLYWCACGESEAQPWCDGSHEGTEFEPLEVVIDEKRTAGFCQCKQTATPPFCDGAHNNLP